MRGENNTECRAIYASYTCEGKKTIQFMGIGYQGWLYQKILGSGKCDNFKYCLGFEIGKSCAYTVGTWSYLCLLCLQKEENNSKELLELLEA